MDNRIRAIPIYLSILFIALSTVLCSEKSVDKPEPNDTVNVWRPDTSPVSMDTLSLSELAFLRNKAIGKGMNLGNALEAPHEGDWGLVINQSYIQALKDAGFNSVRLPVCWSAHTRSIFPYAIDLKFLFRVDEIIRWCHDLDLTVIITIHHFNELYQSPDEALYHSMFLSIWNQLSKHYLEVDHDKLIFEPLNEPHDNMTAEKWNILLPEILGTIRQIDSLRTLIIDVPDYGNHNSLEKLQIPDSEKNCIVSVRYYLPYHFTHQGAHWVEGSQEWTGTRWTGTDAEKQQVISDVNFVKNWALMQNRPITIGEFGSIINADNDSRVTWTSFVVSQFEAHNFSWSYFDFGVLFRAYDLESNKWIEGFENAFFRE